jgi:hypothetical protein
VERSWKRCKTAHKPATTFIREIREGMSFVDGHSETLRQQLQDGRKQGHYKNLLAANQQVDYLSPVDFETLNN